MSDVTGPISSLPNTLHDPVGQCDEHPQRAAIVRIQGETDSFGCEMHDLCQECADAWRAEVAAADTGGVCDWCGNHAPKLRDRRDYEEGMCGRVYQVCIACINKQNAEDAADSDGCWLE